MKRVLNHNENPAVNLLQNEKVKKSIDNSTLDHESQSLSGGMNNGLHCDIYYALKPVPNQALTLLEDLKH